MIAFPSSLRANACAWPRPCGVSPCRVPVGNLVQEIGLAFSMAGKINAHLQMIPELLSRSRYDWPALAKSIPDRCAPAPDHFVTRRPGGRSQYLPDRDRGPLGRQYKDRPWLLFLSKFHVGQFEPAGR